MLDATQSYWMPFTAQRSFRRNPRWVKSARGMFYYSMDGQQILDAVSGLWCVNAGHARTMIVKAIAQTAADLDYAPAFQVGHQRAFACANRLNKLLPPALNRIFFVNSGSEAVETALKIAIGYHRICGKKGFILVGRQRDYHGVCFGGLSVSGIESNSTLFQPLLPQVEHLPDTHDLERNAFSHGQPRYGVDKAQDLEKLIQNHGADNIAAVIIEPMAGSTGVLVPPRDYLEKITSICRQHAITLIFDEVITAFGRLGHPFACQRFGLTPDIITMAKGLTNGAVPMGAVAVRQEIAQAFEDRPLIGQSAIELPHGYTYSGHPLACAAALATMDIYEQEGLFDRAKKLEPLWQDALHSLASKPHVIDIRNIGLAGAIELEDGIDRAFNIYRSCFARSVLVRSTGNVIALSPPLIVDEEQIATIIATLAEALETRVDQ